MDVEVEEPEVQVQRGTSTTLSSGVHQANDHGSKGEPVVLVVDVANLCFGYQKSKTNRAVNTKQVPSLVGFQKVIDYFSLLNGVSIGHILVICGVCPRWWGEQLSKDQDSENYLLYKALREHNFLFECENSDHDDNFIIFYAYRKNGFILSNDRYRDHTKQVEHTKWLNSHRLGFMWIKEEFVPSPKELVYLEEALHAVLADGMGGMEVEAHQNVQVKKSLELPQPKVLKERNTNEMRPSKYNYPLVAIEDVNPLDVLYERKMKNT